VNGTPTPSTIAVKPRLSEDEVEQMASRLPGHLQPSSAFGRENDQSPKAAKRYVIRHEVGHALANAVDQMERTLRKHPLWGTRHVSDYAGEDQHELVAEALAWYTSPDYDGSLDEDVEAALDGLLR